MKWRGRYWNVVGAGLLALAANGFFGMPCFQRYEAQHAAVGFRVRAFLRRLDRGFQQPLAAMPMLQTSLRGSVGKLE